jgi:transforming growth factor-beta-induced protein
MFRFAPLFIAYLAVPAFAALGAQTSRQLQTTIVDLAVATPSLSTLVQAVTEADLAGALSNPAATLTVFAPDNDAFGALPPGLLTALLTPGFKKHLEEILLYHVYGSGAIESTALAPTQDIQMLNGEMLTVAVTATGVTVTTMKGQTATVIMADVVGSNGVAHVIDGVLLPSSIGDTVIVLGADYSTLLSLITLAGLEGTLAGGPFTLFAPTNMAFEALDAATETFLTSAAGLETLKSILTYHVVSGSVTSDMLVDGMMVPTAQGADVTFMVNGASVMVNDANVVMADMLAFNGVTHGIDKILMPPAPVAVEGTTDRTTDSMAPTMAPASGGIALGASLTALFAAVFVVAL